MTSNAPPQPRSAGRSIPFSDTELFGQGSQTAYTGAHLDQIAFPLGGIGAGCVSFSGRGELVDWEIFNRPNKGYRPRFTFFTLYARRADDEPIFRVLEGRLPPHYQGPPPRFKTYAGLGFGPPVEHGAGFLRIAECAFTGEFPFCRVELADPDLPLRVSTSAWSPFIPLNDADSSLPVAVFDITLTNTSNAAVEATVALGLENIIGYPEVGGALNTWVEGASYRGIVMSTEKHSPASVHAGSLALLTPDSDVTWQLRFAETAWFAASESLLDEFGATGEFIGPREPMLSAPEAGDVAQLGLKASLGPGQSATRTFVLTWLTPNAEKYWGLHSGTGSQHGANAATGGWPTYQGLRWEDAHAVGRYVIDNLARLRSESQRFADTFFSSTLPAYVLESIASQMATLRTPTVTRLPDGTVWAWEGCMSDIGCCEGTCTHVWAYAQTMAHLFPRLERGIREKEFAVDLRSDDGHMQFRMPLPPGTLANHAFHAAVDGQMACVLRTYREWQLHGDEAWLRAMWPSARSALEYAWQEWDADRDGLLEGIHHNTLDIEFHGPDTMCGSMYLAALRAGEAMARHLGDVESADAYRKVFEAGREGSDAQLYNGEYYYQPLPDGEVPPYQFGPGCMADQVLGQWHARMLGLGDLYDPEHVRSALAAIFRHNFRDDLLHHQNPHRVYALNDEKALLICTWPRGGRPKGSVTYAFECWTGVEYQAAAHMIYEGFLREGLAICKAVRDRHDGRRRNPFNEFECGSHYARAMSNYSLLLALAGFRYAAPERTLYLDPVVAPDEFRCFFSVDSGWGAVSLDRNGAGLTVHITPLEGTLALERASICGRVVSGDAIQRTEAGGYVISA